MKLENYFKLEVDESKIKWRLIMIILLGAWLIYSGDQEIGLSLLTGAWTTKGE